MEDNFSLGSVQYSILEPGVFTSRPENKDKWVLMNGQDIQGSDLCNLIPTMKNVPDGRGVFIRAMNLGRSSDTGDADGDLRGLAGFPQSDQFKSHDHGGGNHAHHWTGSVTLDTWGGNCGIGGNNCGPKDTPLSGNIINIEGGAETRPRNIALYLYIKINN